MTASIDPKSAIDTFCEAAELNRDDPLRKGSQLVFGDYGQLVVTGDLHGNRYNFDKLVKYCGLASAPARHVILQELIHQEIKTAEQQDLSHEILLEAARWKCEFPDQIFLLQSNHEVAQLTGRGLLKDGRGVLEDFVVGVDATYGAEATPKVIEAIERFIESFPLAARTANRVFISHSLPSEREMPDFDPSVLDRPVTREDLDGGPASKFLWGRRHPRALLQRLAEILDADLFIVGHQPQDMGFRQVDERLLILSSDHSHGVFLPIDLSKPATMAGLVKKIRKFVSVG